MIMAEREGFEPSIRFNPYTHFPGVRLQPLGHLSNFSTVFVFCRLPPKALRACRERDGCANKVLFAYPYGAPALRCGVLTRYAGQSNPRYGLTRIHTYPACAFSHWATSPFVLRSSDFVDYRTKRSTPIEGISRE